MKFTKNHHFLLACLTCKPVFGFTSPPGLEKLNLRSNAFNNKNRLKSHPRGSRGLGSYLGDEEDTDSLSEVTTATQLIGASELYTDTVYSESVVASNDVHKHAVIEGARGRLKYQSNLTATDPAESAFLDTGYHFGPPELVQLEQNTTTSDWELVHYRYPWSSRNDTARTDGLERTVIMDSDDGLDSPEGVWAISGSFTNQAYNTGDTASINMKYALFVQQSSGNHFIAIGTGVAELAKPYTDTPDHPLTWSFQAWDDIPNTPDLGDISLVDTYTSPAWSSDFTTNEFAQYEAQNAVEHILLYGSEYLVVLTLLDCGLSSSAQFSLQQFNYPNSGSRVLHLEWTAPDNQDETDWYYIDNLVFANGKKTYFLYSSSSIKSTTTGFQYFSEWVSFSVVTHNIKSFQYSKAKYAGNELELSDLESAHDLYSVSVDSRCGDMFCPSKFVVKIANIKGEGIFLLVVTDFYGPDPLMSVTGAFPLQLPDYSGHGEVTVFSGGTTKFGGFRFIANDDEGNLFIMRQLGISASSVRYDNPVYALWDESGSVWDDSSFQSTKQSLPTNTSSSSNLHNLTQCVGYVTFGSLEISDSFHKKASYNLLLQAALAFGTDETSSAQGVWLGNGYEAAYAPKRFGQDSAHVVVREDRDSSGETSSYTVQAVYKEPINHSWHKRTIAKQSTVAEAGQYDTSDHYHAIFTLANSAGQAVAITNDTNTDVVVEVRAAAPCTVVDDTNNYFHDIDQYTSFTASPDRSTSSLTVAVKAETFSQILYARIITSHVLNQTASDTAMLDASYSYTYSPWISIDLAAQAQARMSNSESSRRRLGAIADESVYVSESTLQQSYVNNTWQLKGNFTATSDTLSGVASFVNSAGVGMSDLPNSTDDVDPLTSTASISATSDMDTTFSYSDGSVTTGDGRRLLEQRKLSFWSSVKHAVSDVVHAVAHATEIVLEDAAISIVADGDKSLFVTITAGLMKIVNGVAKEVYEVVSTVAKLTELVVSTLTSMVEGFVEFIIALISLFLHFKDIVKLSKSFMTFFKDLIDDFPSVSFDCTDTLSKFLGESNVLQSSMGNADSDSIATEFVEDALKLLTNMNPLAKKILNKITGLVTKVENDILEALPISFGMDDASVSGYVEYIDTIGLEAVSSVSSLSMDTAVEMVENMVEDAMNPQGLFESMESDLGDFVEGFSADVFDPLCELIDDVATEAPAYLLDILEYDELVVISDTIIVDLFSLFGVGNVQGSSIYLSGEHAMLFPLAIIVWVVNYELTGNSISSIDQLGAAVSSNRKLSGSYSEATIRNYIKTSVDVVLGEVSSLLAVLGFETGSLSTLDVVGVLQSMFGMIGRANDIYFGVWMIDQEDESTSQIAKVSNDWNLVFAGTRLLASALNYYFYFDGENNPGKGWEECDPKRTDTTNMITGAFATAAIGNGGIFLSEMGYDYNGLMEYIGGSVMASGGLAAFIINIFPSFFTQSSAGKMIASALMVVLPLGGLLTDYYILKSDDA